MLISNVHEAKTNLSKLIELALAGEEVVVAKAGKTVAKIVKYKTGNKKSVAGIWKPSPVVASAGMSHSAGEVYLTNS